AAEIEHQAGIVDENVEAPELRFEEGGERRDVSLVSDVEFHGVRVNAFGFELVRRLIRFCVVSRAQHDCNASPPELAGYFKAESFVRSGDQRASIRMHFPLLLLLID